VGKEVLRSRTSLVEIDLSRGGRHVLAFPLTNLAPRVHTGYMVCVRRGNKRRRAEVYPMPLAERLPVIRVPLRPSDADVSLDLQTLVDQCYENGGYDNTEYRQPPEPPFAPSEAAWADEWLRAKGLR
jgi:hypothetical protein